MEHNVPVQSLIDHIKTAIDVDPWAKEMAEDLLRKQEAQKFLIDENGKITPLPIAFPNRPMNDLVEVVRCRDCAYALFKEGVVEPRHIVCTKPYTERWQAVKPNNWFCADGVVKDNCSEFPNSSVALKGNNY